MENKKFKKGTILTVTLVVIATLLFNTVVWLLPRSLTQKDITENGFYTLSEDVDSFLRNLDREITLYFIDADGNDQKFEYFIEHVASRSSNIILEKVGLKDSEELLAQWSLTTDHLESMGYCLIAQSEKRTEIVDYSSLFYYEVTNSTLNSMGLTKLSVSEYMYYASYFSQNPNYESYLSYLVNESYRYFQGETVIAAMLEYVAAEVIPVNYALTGHGEYSMSASVLSEISTYNGKTYKTLDIRTATEIPDDAATVLVLAPESDYTVREIQTMRSYLERGGQMTFVTNEKQLSMPNLMSLMASYGMTAVNGSVGEQITVTEKNDEGEEEELIQNSDSVTVTLNTQHDALAMLDQITGLPAPIIIGGNALKLDNGISASLIVTPLLTTSERAYIGENTDSLGKRILAAAAETADGARLAWFTGADSYLIKAEEIMESTDARLSNNYCLYVLSEWTELTYESKLSYPDAIIYDTGFLQASTSDATAFGVFMVFVIPAAIVGGGFVIVYQRKKRSER